MDALIFSFLIAAIIVGIIVWIMSAVTSGKLKYIDQRLQRIPDFTQSISYKSGQCDNAIAIDVQREKIAVITNPATSITLDPIVYCFSDLVAAEIVRDDASVTKTNRGSQVAGAEVGGVLLGPAGLLVGGLSASRRHEDKIRKLSLKLYSNNLMHPVQEVVFWDSGATGTDPKLLQPVLAELDQWYGRLRAILERKAQMR